MSIAADKIDHVNVKIFAHGNPKIDLEPAIPMFHRWIQDALLDELMIDLADYRHVPAGPGVMLIGHQVNYSLDLTFSRLGLLYNRKLPLEGSLEDKLQEAFASALAACALIEEDPAFRGKLEFNAGECEIIFNDRLLVPNTEASWNSLGPVVAQFLDNLFGKDAYTINRVGDPRERLRLAVQASRYIPVAGLLERSAVALSKQ